MKDFNYYQKKPLKVRRNVALKLHHTTFLKTPPVGKFDFITAIYVFPHFVLDEFNETAKKIHSLLGEGGRFILVVANEQYLKGKLKTMKDLFIENNTIHFGGKKYNEVLHYSDIPEIGKIIDYNREESFYLDLFRSNRFRLLKKTDLDDSGFICTVYVFEKI